MTDAYAQTRVDMFELGWFGQGPAFWRWVRSDEALPYVRACAAMRQQAEGEGGKLDGKAAKVMSDPRSLAMLADWIEATFAEDAPPPNR